MLTTKFASECLSLLYFFLIKFFRASFACWISTLRFSKESSNSLRCQNGYYATMEGPKFYLPNSTFTNIPLTNTQSLPFCFPFPIVGKNAKPTIYSRNHQIYILLSIFYLCGYVSLYYRMHTQIQWHLFSSLQFLKKGTKFQNCLWQNEHSSGIHVPRSSFHFSILSATLMPELPSETQKWPGHSSTQNIVLFCMFFSVMCKISVMDIQRDSDSIWLFDLAEIRVPFTMPFYHSTFLSGNHTSLTTQSITLNFWGGVLSDFIIYFNHRTLRNVDLFELILIGGAFLL